MHVFKVFNGDGTFFYLKNTIVVPSKNFQTFFISLLMHKNTKYNSIEQNKKKIA